MYGLFMKPLEEFERKLYIFALRAQRGEDLESIKGDYEKAKLEFIQKSTLFIKSKGDSPGDSRSTQAVPS